MVERELLRLMLKYDFWDSHKQNILREMFPSNLQSVYDLISRTHEKLKKDLSIQEVKGLWTTNNPVASKAQKDALFLILEDLPRDISNEVASEIIKKAYIIESARRLAEQAIQVVNGKEINIEKARKALEGIEQGTILGAESLEAASSEIEDILAAINTTTKWSFNLTPLKEKASGIGPGIFAIIVARTEVGKSSFHTSLCAAPGGFAEQGAVCHIFGNEEPIQRLQGRGVMAATGMTLNEIIANPEQAKEIYNKVRQNLKYYDAKGMDITDLRYHIEKHKPDIVVTDQLDKFSIKGNFARNDERLGALYTEKREIADKYNHGSIAITQASANAEGKSYLSSVDLAESRTAKAAEGDLVIGIGKAPLHEDTSRVINLIKNKVLGWNGQFVCVIQPEISRYIA